MITLTEVARAAGVSITTASRVFKNPDRVAQETRDLVVETAAKLNYHGARPKDSLQIGLVVPDISNPVISMQIAAIQEQAWQERHRITLVSTAEEETREVQVLKSLLPHVDGYLVVSPRISPMKIREIVGERPLVIINGDSAEVCPTVLTSADTGILQAFEHLAALGHEHIAYAPGPARSWANDNRYQAVQAMACQWDIQLSVVGNQAASVQGGLAAAASIVASGATAVIAYNDLVALGIRAGCRALGVQSPENISIIGIDDFAVAAISEPALTSIHIDFQGACSLAFSILRDLMTGSSVTYSAEHRKSQLIIRGSTSHAPDIKPRPLAKLRSHQNHSLVAGDKLAP